MQIDENEYRAFLSGVSFRTAVIPSTGEQLQLPLLGHDGVMMACVFTADRAAVIAALPSPDFVPPALPDDRTLVIVTAFEYKRRNIPPYNETIVGVPVLHGRNVAPPDLSRLLGEGGASEGLGLYVHQIAVTTRLAEKIGNELLGYNKFVADIEFQETDTTRSCQLANEGQSIFNLEITKPEDFVYERDTMAAYMVQEGPGYRVGNRLEYEGQYRVARSTGPHGRIELGDHPLGGKVRELDLSQEAVHVQYAPHFQLISCRHEGDLQRITL